MTMNDFPRPAQTAKIYDADKNLSYINIFFAEERIKIH